MYWIRIALGAFMLIGVALATDARHDVLRDVRVRESKSPVDEELKFIRRYSGFYRESDSKHTLIPGSLKRYDDQLTEINTLLGKKVNVHVLLINGLTYPRMSLLSKDMTNVSQIFNWADQQKKLGNSSRENVSKETKDIIERIAEQDSKLHSTAPTVYLALTEFILNDGVSTGKKIILFHSTYYNFSDGKNYCDGLNAMINAVTWTGDHDSNLAALIELVRKRSVTYGVQGVNNTALASLKTKLMATDKRFNISLAIDTLDKGYLLAFDNELRGHVVSTLVTPSNTPTVGYSVIGSMGSVDPSFARNSLKVLEYVPDEKVKDWFAHIATVKRIPGKTILQQIVANTSDGFFAEANYTKFISIINKQLQRDPGFTARYEALLTRENILDQIVVWDKSYFLKALEIAPIGTNTYEVELTTDGKLKVTRSTVASWKCARVVSSVGGMPVSMGERCTPVWKTESPKILEPFDAILFVNRSDLSLFTNNDAAGNVEVVPAMHLLYARQKQWNKNVGTGISTTIDVVTIAIPITKLKYGSSLARKIIYGIEVSDKVAALANMPVNLGFPGNRYEEIVKAYNAIQIVASLGALGYRASASDMKQMAEYVRSVNKYEDELIDLGKANENVRYVVDLKNKIDQEASALKGVDWVEKVGPPVRTISSLAGQAVKGGKNLLNIEEKVVGKFRQLKGTSGTYRAATFWNTESDDFIHYISADAKYYIKHDPGTGRMLFLQIDPKPEKFIGFALDQDNLIKGDYAKLLNNLKTLHGLPGGSNALTVLGETVKLSTARANILLGKYKPNDVPGISNEIGTNDVIDELTLLKNYSFADDGFSLQPGSVHVLNIPDANVNDWATFFEDFNSAFLDAAIKNKNNMEIIYVTDPRKFDLLDTYDKATQAFKGTPSGLAKEVRYLRDRGITTAKLKDGTVIDLTKIDLSKLDWTGWKY